MVPWYGAVEDERWRSPVMMAEHDVFAKLIARHGVPRILIPNTPCCHFMKRNSGSCFVAETPPAGVDPLSYRVSYYRVPLGREPFLLVRTYIEIDASKLGPAREILTGKGVIEVLRGGTRRGPRGGTKPVVRIAVREEVRPLTGSEFDAALEERRLLAVNSERSMGDCYVAFNIVTRGVSGHRDALRLLFDTPCRLMDDEVAFAPSDGSWRAATEVLDAFREHFIRPFTP